MRVLLYGSFAHGRHGHSPEHLELVQAVARTVLRRGHELVTREGNRAPTTSVPVDNPALEAAGALAQDSPALVAGKITTFCDPSKFAARFETNVPRRLIEAPRRGRMRFYALLLNACDVVVTMSGGAGVQRLGLISGFAFKPHVPVAFTGGASQELWRDLDQALSDESSTALSREEYLWLGSTGMETPQYRAERIVDIAEALVKRQKQASVQKHLDVDRLRPADIAKAMTVGQWVAVGAVAVTLSGALYYLGHVDLLKFFEK